MLRVVVASFLVLVACLGSAVTGQSAKHERAWTAGWRADPYTRGGARALERAGIVALGAMPWGRDPDHSTEAIERVLGAQAEVRWIETAHFRIGCSLEAYRVQSGRERKKVRAELERLREKLPSVRPGRRTLDPWLRAHLLAQRCEEAYGRFLELVGLEDAAFPADPSLVDPNGPWRGRGPYLGTRRKFLVLVTARASTLGRYTQHFLRRTFRHTQRHNLGYDDALMLGSSAEFDNGNGYDDTRLHCSIVYSLVHNFIDGLCGFGHDVPAWLKTGLAQAECRRIDVRYPQFDRPSPDAKHVGRDARDWETKIARRVANGAYTPAGDLFAWHGFARFELHDFLTCWSRVEFLLARDRDAFGRFVLGLKDRIAATGVPAWQDVVAQHDAALLGTFDLTPKTFDAAWADWVEAGQRVSSR